MQNQSVFQSITKLVI